ncbi:MAG: flagellar motor switch phosphatase FliY [Bacillota bacterium]
MTELILKPLEKEIIRKIGNASVNAVPQALAAFVRGAVRVQAPDIQLKSMDSLTGLGEKGLLARIVFREGLTGQQYFFFPGESAALLAALLLGKEPPAEPPEEPAEMEKSALSEAVGMIMGVYTTSLSGFLNSQIGIDAPQIEYISPAEKDFSTDGLSAAENWVVLRFILEVEPAYQVIFLQYIPYAFMREMIAPLLPPQADAAKEAAGTDTPSREQQALLSDLGDLPEKEKEDLNMLQKDALAEVGNISLGASATALAKLLNRRVQITTPAVTLTTMAEVRANYPTPCLVVTVNYSKGLTGHNILILKRDDALAIVGVMMGLEPPERLLELGEMEISGISEAMNQMMGSAATAMSDLFQRTIDISPPHVEVKDLHVEKLDIAEMDDENLVVQVAFHMEVEALLDSKLLQLIPLPFARGISDYLLSSVGAAEPEGEDIGEDVLEDFNFGDISVEDFLERSAPATTEVVGLGKVFAGEEQAEEAAAGLFSGLEMFTRALAGDTADNQDANPNASTKVWQDYEYSRIDMIRDIPVNIHVLLGKTRLPLKKIFSILPGEAITLDRYLGEPVDVFANDRLVAKGEVVMVNGQFGFKIIDMIRPQH